MSEHASQAVIGWGSEVAYEDPDNPGQYLEVHESRAMQPPNEQADEVEVTHFGSPNRKKEYIGGLIDSGEAGFEVNWKPDVYSDHRQIAYDKVNGTVRNWRYTLPSGMHVYVTSAFVKGMNPTVEPSGAVTMAVTLRCSATTETFDS